jgi:hypothetical protein
MENQGAIFEGSPLVFGRLSVVGPIKRIRNKRENYIARLLEIKTQLEREST